MFSRIKRHIPEKWKLTVNLWFTSDHDPRWTRYATDGKRHVFVFLAGFYQNLGDMALTYAQVNFLQKLFPDAEIVPIASTSTYQAAKTIKTFIRPDDLVTILGGGNMDDMYVSLEEARLHVIKSFPNNRIVCFPQTMAFSDTVFGEKRRNISHKIYAKHKNMTLFVREPNSLARVKKYWSDLDIGYCPDMVLSLDKRFPICERTDVMCCLRHDKELNLAEGKTAEIIHALQQEYPNLQVTDTVDVASEECQPDSYAQTLESFWARLRKCRIVITDRLHCMIFCVITGTPCVVLDNSNHKISGVYNQWLQDVANIKYIENTVSPEEITTIAKTISAGKFPPSNLGKIHARFQELREKCM